MSVNRAAYFRTVARDSLRGRWKKAVLTGFLAALLGGIMNAGPGINFEFKVEGPAVSAISMTVLATIAAVVSVLGIVFWVIGSIVRIGYGKFNLDLVDGEDIRTGTLFAYFPHWKNALLTSFLQTLYQLLWTLLLIVPGIMASYSYAMTPYILAEDPTLSATEAITLSKSYMVGNRWRLFCMQFSFIGWNMLAVFSLGIGMLWVVPYEQAAMAAFYREVSGTAKTV